MGIILPGDKLRAVYHEVVCVCRVLRLLVG